MSFLLRCLVTNKGNNGSGNGCLSIKSSCFANNERQKFAVCPSAAALLACGQFRAKVVFNEFHLLVDFPSIDDSFYK